MHTGTPWEDGSSSTLDYLRTTNCLALNQCDHQSLLVRLVRLPRAQGPFRPPIGPWDQPFPPRENSRRPLFQLPLHLRRRTVKMRNTRHPDSMRRIHALFGHASQAFVSVLLSCYLVPPSCLSYLIDYIATPSQTERTLCGFFFFFRTLYFLTIVCHDTPYVLYLVLLHTNTVPKYPSLA